jgi:CBS domain-containing protein
LEALFTSLASIFDINSKNLKEHGERNLCYYLNMEELYTVTTRKEGLIMQVRDFMITKVFTVQPSCTIRELLKVLNSNRIGGVPVVDKKGNLVGMVSDGDVLRFLSPKPQGIIGLFNHVYLIEEEKMEEALEEKLDTPVEAIMTKKNILSVSADEEFESTFRLLSRHHYKKLPVVNGAGRVIGVLSRGDLINNLSKQIVLS